MNEECTKMFKDLNLHENIMERIFKLNNEPVTTIAELNNDEYLFKYNKYLINVEFTINFRKIIIKREKIK